MRDSKENSGRAKVKAIGDGAKIDASERCVCVRGEPQLLEGGAGAGDMYIAPANLSTPAREVRSE